MKKHVILTSHPRGQSPSLAIRWGAASAAERGPLIANASAKGGKNVIGQHAGTYAVYRALAITAGKLNPIHIPDLTNTAPAEPIGPHAQWFDADKIVSLDPWGHMVAEAFADRLAEGWDIRPTIAVTKAHINMPELQQAIAAKRLEPDGKILFEDGSVKVTKAAIEPVWYLPGIAKRFGVAESALRRGLFEYTGGMFPELVTRPDLHVFLPPIGGLTVYFFGDVAAIGDPKRKLACRVHDECNGSDVFGSDICTCRPYLVHGIELCIATAQEGGAGLVVYNRKEGRALGEVVKFLVYNARKRQDGGDRAEKYFERTECIAGVQDMRLQELMPDVLHWLGITRIDRFASMSDLKFKPIVDSGIEVVERVEIPPGLIPPDAQVEMDAKKAAGYFTARVPDETELERAKGRGLTE
ncbi:MAG TPA: GTP cyclohydrolase II [Alphaproteobacteria bacterium]|nr:GTP cyclohydrolase II [Alphaproteobacteria bacterium]